MHSAGRLDAGRLDEAVAAYRRILKRRPRDCACWSNLGMALRQLGRKDEGLDVLRRGARVCPASLHLNYNLGNALADAGDLEGAAERYRTALDRDPRHAGAAEALGRVLLRLERFDAAADHCRQALPNHARSAVVHQVLCAALSKLRHLEPAAVAYRRFVALAPPSSGFSAAGFYWQVLRGLGRIAEAERELRAAAARDAGSADALAALADLLVNQGRLDEARQTCDAALEREPDHAAARFQRARANFLAGDYAAAWPDYAARRGLASRSARDVTAPAWQGEELAGRSILLYGEQGLGDAIQFARYAPLVARRGAEVVLYVPPRLVTLLRRLPGIAAMAPADRPPPPTDRACSLMDVPGIWGADVDSIPRDCPYLPARRRQPPLLPPARQFRVGIVWAGRPTNDLDRRRSCRLADFAPLVELPGTEWVSFQVGPRAAELRAGGWHGLIRDLPKAAVPFDATADALTEVDLVITVDTVLAHLAGAVGRPVWTLLSSASDWRWILGRTDTPWYPTMRLFRQPALVGIGRPGPRGPRRARRPRGASRAPGAQCRTESETSRGRNLVLHAMPDKRYPGLSSVLPATAPVEVQRTWTVDSGMSLLKPPSGQRRGQLRPTASAP